MGKWSIFSDYNNTRYEIGTNGESEITLESYIVDNELRILQQLFGKELYDLFIADLDVNNIPQTQIYIDIFNPFFEDRLTCPNQHFESDGIIEMLRYFTFVDYVNNQKITNTVVGNVASSMENSERASNAIAGLSSRYNRGVESYRAIQIYIIENETSYPTFNGQNKEIKGIL